MRLLVIMFVFFHSYLCFSQDISYIIYDQSRGLAHNHIYSLIQDNEILEIHEGNDDKIWFMSDIFLDSNICVYAFDANCRILYSEDMQHKQVIEKKLTIVNPFYV